MTVWLVTWEYFRRAFAPPRLVALGIVGFIFLIVAGCCLAAQYSFEERSWETGWERDAAAVFSYHFAASWGILFAVMLAMGAASAPFDDGRAAFLFSKPVRRIHVLLGQLLGAFLTALAAAAALGALASPVSLVRAHVFPWTLWLALGVASLAIALAVVFVAFFSMFLPRVVAGLLGIIFYVANFPFTICVIHGVIYGIDLIDLLGQGLPSYEFWGTELKVCYALMPPVARVHLWAANLFGTEGHKWDFGGWLTVAIAAAYVVGLFIATWALYNRRDA